MPILTPKQEGFCLSHIETGNAIDKAYENDQINTVVTAIGGLAQLHGLLVDKKLHGNDPNNPLPPYVEVRFIDPCLAVAKV